MKKIMPFIFLLTILIIPNFANAFLLVGCVPTVNGPEQPFSVYCTGKTTGNVITWTSQSLCSGHAPFTYFWSGDSNINGNTNSSVAGTYSGNGTYTASITVKDSQSNTATATCSATINTTTSSTSILTTPDTTPPTVEVSSESYQDNLTKIMWVIHNNPWSDLNGIKINVAIDGKEAWSGGYGATTINPYSVGYAYALTPGVHIVKTILTDKAGNSNTDNFSFTSTSAIDSNSTSSPISSSAATSINTQAPAPLTEEGILMTISQLQQQIAQLQQQLQGVKNQKKTWCYNFDINLRIGDTGEGVHALQIALGKEGLFLGSTDTFDEQTASAVSGFQENYKDEILTPINLQYGTGFVGKATRVKLNKFYSCGISASTPSPKQ